MDTTPTLTNLTANGARLAAYREYRRTIWCDQTRTEADIWIDAHALDVCLASIRADLDADLDTLWLALPRQREAT